MVRQPAFPPAWSPRRSPAASLRLSLGRATAHSPICRPPARTTRRARAAPMPQARKHSTAGTSAAATTPTELASAAAAPTAVSLAAPIASPASADHATKRAAAPQPPVGYESPLKRLRKTMLQHKRKLIVRIDELREFINAHETTLDEASSKIRIQARLLWCAPMVVNGSSVLRLYLGEQQAPEPLEQQQREYQEAQREDEFEAEQFLITLSLYKVAPDNPRLPAPGSVIAFNPSSIKVFRNCCQVRASLQGITTVVPAAAAEAAAAAP